MKPLFIPLKREYYEAFVSGKKVVEYRKYGPRWNERTCVAGRPVVLSLGYGKKHRAKGTIIGFARTGVLTEDFKKCYGEVEFGTLMAIIWIAIKNSCLLIALTLVNFG